MTLTNLTSRFWVFSNMGSATVEKLRFGKGPFKEFMGITQGDMGLRDRKFPVMRR